MSLQADFYDQIPSVADFLEVMNPIHYVTAPDDWWVVMTDVKGSTDAIRTGKYREVNVLGAAGITAVLNATKGINLPYVFGGDGATILIPESKKNSAEHALRGVQKMSRDKFGLELRVGMVPVRTLNKLEASVQVAKYELSKGNVLAQFRGGGITKAEELIKKDQEGIYNLKSEVIADPPDLTGLSCRLEPFESRHGTILTLLISTVGKESAISYTQIISALENILGNNLRSANPITLRGLRWKWPPATMRIEAKTHSRSWNFPVIYVETLIRTMISHVLLQGTKVVGGFDPVKYKEELIINTDYTKFDDVLRMVVDCSEHQANLIEAYLTALHKSGDVHFGVHRSPQALMTCMVFSATQNRHLHFVDGSHGGYAMAAVGLKAQK